MADISPPELRAKRMGLIGAAFGIGFVVGPFVGGELSQFSMAAPPFFAAGLAAINFVSALVLLPESRSKEARQRSEPHQLRGRLGVIRSVPGVGTILGLVFAQLTAFSMLEMAFTLFLNDRVGYEEHHAGRVFAYIGVVLAVVQGGMIGRLARRFGEIRLVRGGLLLVGSGMVALTQLPAGQPPLSFWHIVALLGMVGLVAVGQGIVNPSLSALLSRRTPGHIQGVALGVSHSLGALARIVGPLTAGILYEAFDENMPFYVGGALMALAWGLALVLLTNVPTEAAAPPVGVAEVSSEEV